jgi:hypothetical protein
LIKLSYPVGRIAEIDAVVGASIMKGYTSGRMMNPRGMI